MINIVQKVLIVEDDAIIARFIQIKLEELGYEICGKARDGNEAIAMANLHQPDLILMDVMLDGELDGIETVEIILQNLDVPIVYLTASSDDKTIHRLMKTEPHGFLIKPFDDKILASALHIAVYRHKAKKELSEAKEMLRTTIESIDDMVFSLDSQGVFTHNHSGVKQTHLCFNVDNIKGKSLIDLFPEPVSAQMMQSIQELKRTGDSQSIEFSLNSNNSRCWFTSRFTLRRSKNSDALGITMVLTDITRSKIMYEELALSREKLSEAFAIAGLGSCDFFFSEQKYICNDLFFHILGVPETEDKNAFDNKRLLKTFHPEDRSKFLLTLQKAMDLKKTDLSFDLRVVNDKQEVKYIHALCRLKYDNEQPAHLIMTIQDVSWQKTNDALRHDIELARKTAEMKQNFFAKLSHEIRNPVNGIAGTLHLFEKTNLDTLQVELLQNLNSSAEALLELVNDVLDFSKIESGMMKVKTNPFRLSEQIKKLGSFFQNKANEGNIKLLFSADEKIPDHLIGDENKITRVLYNLLSNALKFTPRGKVEVWVRMIEKIDNKLVLRFDVEDTGIGVSPEDQKKLFTDFTQVGNQQNGHLKGTGLGLSICKELVELMEGEIGMTSRLNEGSNFWFTLPLTIASELIMEQDIQQDEMQLHDLNISVLLAEDMAVNRKVMKMMLEQMGCKVSLATNGKEAVEMMKETTINAFNIFGRVHYDVVLLDQMMPVMDGVSALEQLKKMQIELPPVIVLTADESFAHDNKYALAGFDDVIIKPVKPAQIFQMLSKWHTKSDARVAQKKLDVITFEEIDKKPVLNPQTVALITRNADENNFEIENLFRTFIEDMELIYQQILSAIEMNDHNALSLIVLSVKGLSGNIGASQLHAVAKLMDRYLRNDEHDNATKLLPLLAEKYSVLKNKIEADFLFSTIGNE